MPAQNRDIAALVRPFRIEVPDADLEDLRDGTQGGDWGSVISPEVARADPDRVVGVHVNANMFIPRSPVSDEELATLTDVERARMTRYEHLTAEGMSYFQQQATRPQTLSYALTDSMEVPDLLAADIRDFFRPLR